MLKIGQIISLLGVCLLIANSEQAPQALKDQSTVVLVNTIFRHGDRTPASNANETYPTDPLVNSTFYPFGIGQLTNSGKRRAYQLGQLFRKRYDKLLGPVYLQRYLTARSTGIIRSKMTLQLVLAGMYPPSPIQKWSPRLIWNPINIISVPIYRDGLLLPFSCPSYLDAANEFMQTADYTEFENRFTEARAYLTEKTGRDVNNIVDMFILYHGMFAKAMMGYKLEDWTKAVFPYGALRDATVLQYHIASYTTTLNRRNGGMLLRRMIENMKSKINGTTEEMKMNLFSAQEITVAAMLKVLGVFEEQIPGYCSAVILELHKINDAYFVKTLYNYGVPEKVVELRIPGCEVMCPFEQFVALNAEVIPTGDELQCDYPEPEEL